MLALLALALFPVAAQAECTTSSCATYETEVPSVDESTLKENPLNSGGHEDGNTAEANGSDAEEGSSGGPEEESGSEGKDRHKDGGGSPSGGGGNNPPNSSGGKTAGSGNPGGIGEGKAVEDGATGEPASSSSGGSSPVIPILIAVAVLAAISIGVVLYRQRKSGQDPDGRGSVSSSNAS